MADITSGRVRKYDNLQGGVREIYFFNYLDDAFTVAANVATAMNAGLTAAYKYVIQGDGNTLQESAVSDKKIGTKVNTQTLVTQLKQINSATNVQLDLMLEGQNSAVIKDWNNQYRWVAPNGFNVTSTAESVTGGTRTDFNGYNVTLISETKDLAPILDSSTVTAFLAVVS